MPKGVSRLRFALLGMTLLRGSAASVRMTDFDFISPCPAVRLFLGARDAISRVAGAANSAAHPDRSDVHSFPVLPTRSHQRFPRSLPFLPCHLLLRGAGCAQRWCCVPGAAPVADPTAWIHDPPPDEYAPPCEPRWLPQAFQVRATASTSNDALLLLSTSVLRRDDRSACGTPGSKTHPLPMMMYPMTQYQCLRHFLPAIQNG